MSLSAPPTPANPGPLVRAGQTGKTVQDPIATTPTARDTVTGWFRPITIGVRSTTIGTGATTGGQAQVVTREVKTSGVAMPLSDRELQILPEGQRAWRWKYLYVTEDLGLKTGDNAWLKGIIYRVMSSKDWSDYGYWRYVIVSSYGNPSA